MYAELDNGLIRECAGQLRIMALTGIRSEYDLLFPLLQALERSEAVALGVIVSGAHLTDLHDHSVRQIERDGFRIVERIENLFHSNTHLGKLKSAAALMTALGQTLTRERPDLLLLLGDREEAIAGCLAGTYLGIPLVHLAGGDNTTPAGGVADESIRHAATKLSHVHLAMTGEHAERILRLGEEPWRVHAVGSGGVDRLRLEPGLSPEAMRRLLGEGVDRDYAVLIHHPLGFAHRTGDPTFKNGLEGTLAAGCHVFLGAPNSDPGAQEIEAVMRDYRDHPGVTQYRNLPRDAFITLLRGARCLVGNSSLAFHEAAFLGLPAVNVGERQKGRLSAGNVRFVDGDPEAVRAAVAHAAFDAEYRGGIPRGNTLYGDGHMAERSLKILLSLPVKGVLTAKKMTY